MECNDEALGGSGVILHFLQEHRVGCSYATVPIRQDINKQTRDIFTDLDTNGRGESEMGGLRDSMRYQTFYLGPA